MTGVGRPRLLPLAPFGVELRAAIARSRFANRSAFARGVGIPFSSLRRYENGERVPSDALIRAWADELGVAIGERDCTRGPSGEATTRSYLLCSLPNSGSTWLGDIVGRAIGRYQLEYFNPLRNPAREHVLVRNFGCELAACFHNIASPGDEHVHDDVRGTWPLDGHAFTKEVFSPFKLPVFVEHFRCAVLTRSPIGVFPPTRARVWSFYEHAWHALHAHRYRVVMTSVRDRALEAHALMTARLEADAARLGVPVIRYEALFEPEHVVRAELERWLDGAVLDRVVDDVLRTRVRKAGDAWHAR